MGSPIPLSALDIGNDTYDSSALNLLLPMHVKLDKSGLILHIGPTLSKLFGTNSDILGQNLFDFIAISYPKNIKSLEDLNTLLGKPLIVQIKSQTAIDLKAVAVHMPYNNGLLINFTFGTSLKKAVECWNLTCKDFSPADPAIEMLYVIEVQSALLEESRNLNDRLDGQRVEAEEQAFTDPLTGLSNRRALDRYIKRLCRRRKNDGFALLLIDLDHFKQVNDTLGHAAGDQVLKYVAGVLLNETRPTDIVSRNGGDEFVLVFEDIQAVEILEAIAERIIRKIKQPVHWKDQECVVGASIGIVFGSTKSDNTIDFYLQAADQALYASKKNGRGAYHFAK